MFDEFASTPINKDKYVMIDLDANSIFFFNTIVGKDII